MIPTTSCSHTMGSRPRNNSQGQIHSSAILHYDRSLHITGGVRQCWFCETPLQRDLRKKCTGCRKAIYCNSICQKADWRDHKQFCQKNQIAYCAICTEMIRGDDHASQCTIGGGRQHYYHSTCIRRWERCCLRKNVPANCPLCRGALDPLQADLSDLRTRNQSSS